MDPYSRGILHEANFNKYRETRRTIIDKWGSPDDMPQINMTLEESTEEMVNDPLEELLRQRNISGSSQSSSQLSALEEEMIRYESFPRVDKNTDAISWWKTSKDVFPILNQLQDMCYPCLHHPQVRKEYLVPLVGLIL